MKRFLDEEMKQMSVLNSEVAMVSTLNDNNKSEMDTFVDSILDSMDMQIIEPIEEKYAVF